MLHHIVLRAFLGFCLGICAAVPTAAHAGFEIAEIMYDVPGTDAGREWVEVRNAGTSAEDLSLWKLFEAGVAHKISAPPEGGDPLVPAGGYAVIADSPAKFLADNPGYAGPVFDSAFSLSSAETISMRDPSGEDADVVSYASDMGAKGDGLSLQKTADGRWVSAAPTPGAPTTATESEVLAAPGESPAVSVAAASSTPSAHESQAVANRAADAVELEVTSGRDRIGFTNSPVAFEAKIRKSKGSAAAVSHEWSFGDGSRAAGANVSHAYAFPGDYVVMLNSRLDGALAASKVFVRIVDPGVAIESAERGVVRLKNPNEHEVNVGGMTISYGNKRLFIARDTVIQGSSSVPFAFPAVAPGAGDYPVVLLDAAGMRIAEAVPRFDDPYVELPPGLTPDSLRARIVRALDNR